MFRIGAMHNSIDTTNNSKSRARPTKCKNRSIERSCISSSLRSSDRLAAGGQVSEEVLVVIYWLMGAR
jgi:hypothetical protein